MFISEDKCAAFGCRRLVRDNITTKIMRKPGDEYYLRAFEDLVYDAVHLLYQAHDVDEEQDEDGYQFTYVRSSILNTVLLLECAANCCIDALKLPRSFQEDIDKLPFLSKYEFFLRRVNASANFDRGCRELQQAAELKSVRDGYVHPRVSKGPWIEVLQVWETDSDATRMLKIPRNPNGWCSEHGVVALKAANDFFNRFFLSWCEFDSDTVCGILLSGDMASIPATSITSVDAIGQLDRAVTEWGIDFRFLGKVLPALPSGG